ncbi:hypothetical protein HMPREF9144_1867, partial [Prevotella pallens ATCC 700821]
NIIISCTISNLQEASGLHKATFFAFSLAKIKDIRFNCKLKHSYFVIINIFNIFSVYFLKSISKIQFF